MTENLLRTPGPDRRRHPRYDAEGIDGVLNGDQDFRVVKISLGGLMIRLEEEPSFSEIARVEIRLDRVPFRSRARVVYAGPDMTPDGASKGSFRVGLAFVDPTPEQQLRLERYLARHHDDRAT